MKPQKPSYTRGLPDDRSIGELSKVGLEEQSKLWPELTAQGLVPKSTPEVIEQLRGRLKGRYLGTQTTAQAILPVLVKLACCYARYSCDRSTPISRQAFV